MCIFCFKASLKLYLRVSELFRNKEQMDVPAEILNNIGSLYLLMGQFAEAKQYYEDAKRLIMAEGEENLNDEMTAMLITTSYNLGRANELSIFDEAGAIYKEVIQRRPTYIDCTLRLGCLYRDKGDQHKA